MTGSLGICLIGFGEVGQILAAELAPKSTSLAAWDLKFDDPQSAPSRAAHLVRKGRNAADAAAGATLVISAVTAAQTFEAAQSVSGAISRDAFFLDLNSASPGEKRTAAKEIATAGGLYVEAAVMSPVPPKRLAAPMLLGGPHAKDFMPLARDLGFVGATLFSNDIGKASAAKMCRSVMVKGMEALLAESLVTARRHGVEETVLSSLSDLLPGPDWPKLADYMIRRSVEHGARRAEEMREAARTVEEAGLRPLMSLACAARQESAAAFANVLPAQNLAALLDAIAPGAETKEANR